MTVPTLYSKQEPSDTERQSWVANTLTSYSGVFRFDSRPEDRQYYL